ncbi:glutamate ABC transporter substrate-binding protein [Actinoallomurus vinaceus]|uniref:Glutamate ABC transporter substrate-binding protein n=1 Tax=Actinoallomurus vinaceus TaxID=1080074 RepID=A0ABP8TZJ3_9ACTN
MILVDAKRRMCAALIPACALVAAASACGDGSGQGLPPASGSADAYQQVIDAAPTARGSDIPAGSLMAKIKSRGTLIVGGTETAALFSLKDPISGKTRGFDAGLAAMLAKYIIGKPDVKLMQVSVNTREALLQNGTVDTVFATYTITPERAKKVAFAGPYYSSGDAILVKKGEKSINSASDLNNRTVCTETSSVAANDIKKAAPKAKVVLFDQNTQCVQAVEDGRADAYVLDQGILLGDAYRDHKVTVVGQPFTTEPYGIGLSQSAPEMKTFVNNWLKLIQTNGQWSELWKATIGTAVSGDAPRPLAIGSVAGS